MNYWIICILRIRSELGRMWNAIDKAACSAALSVTCDAMELCELIMEFNDKKRRLANIKVLYDAVKNALTPEEFSMLVRYAKNVPTEILAGEYGVSRYTVLRRIKKALRICVGTVAALGYDKEKFERDYFPFAVIKSVYSGAAKKNGARDVSLVREPRFVSGVNALPGA